MEDVWAWATGWRTGKGYMTSTIQLNVDMATSWEACNQQMQDELRTNWAFGDPNRPVYSSIVHEFGYAVDYSTREGKDARRAAHEQTKQVLEKLWQDMAPDVATAFGCVSN